MGFSNTLESPALNVEEHWIYIYMSTARYFFRLFRERSIAQQDTYTVIDGYLE